MKTPLKLRWTVEAAALEFVVDRASLASKLRQAEIAPGKDGKFSTAQICTAIYSDLKLSRTRMVEAQAAREEVRLARERCEVVDVTAARQYFSNVFFAIRRIILTSALPKESQDAIIKELAEIKESDLTEAK